MLSNDIKVTVCIVCYNQEEYIEECIRSVLNQKVDYDIEVIVSDDCSTDNTPNIIRRLAESNAILRPIFRTENVGPLFNFVDTHARARGKYICHLDGDDLFLPSKLAVQSRVLDLSPDISLVAHPVKVHGKDTVIGKHPSLPKIGTIEDLILMGTYFANSSTMYRNGFLENDTTVPTVDFNRFVRLASHGNIYLCAEVLGEYRVHSGGISKDAKFFDVIQQCYDRAYEDAVSLGVAHNIVAKGMLRRNMSLGISFLLKSDFTSFRHYIERDYQSLHATLKHRLLKKYVKTPLLASVIRKLHGVLN